MNQNKSELNDPVCYSLDIAIKSTREDMHMLIDFYSGARTLNNKPSTLRTEADHQRFFWTLRQLQERIETLQKQRDQLTPKNDCHD